MKNSIRISILMVIAIISNSNLFAATITWSGASSTVFATGANWVGGNAPAAGDDVIIPASVTSNRWPVVGSNTVSLLSITLNGGTLSSSGNSNISATTITINGGTFTRGSGNLTATTINLSGGTINLSNRSLPTLTYNSGTLTFTSGATVTTFNMAAGSFTNSSTNMTITTLNVNGGTFTRGTGTLTLANLTLNGGSYVNGSSNLSLSGTFTQETGTFTQGSYNITAGIFILNGGTFNGSSGTITVNNGAMDINNGTFVAGSGNIELNDNNNADFTVANGATFTGGTGTLSNTSGGDLLIDGTATFAYNKFSTTSGGSFTVDGGAVTITGTGDIVFPGDFGLISGSFNFNNNDISVADRYTFGNITLTNEGDSFKVGRFRLNFTGVKTLTNVINVVGEVEFLSGELITSLSDIVIFQYNSFISAQTGEFPTDAKHIVGPAIKLISSTNTTPDFTFPIGNGNVYAPIQISSYGSRRNGDFFIAQYFSSRHPNAGGSKANTLNLVSQAEYWILDRGALSGTATTTATVTMSYNTGRSGSITNASLLRVARWNGSQWADEGRASTSSTTAASGSLVSLANVTSFSPFTFGSTTNVNPLPVKLLDFSASAVAANINVKWTTTSEINNDYFNVEKSLDGKNWSVIGTVKGAGNTEALTNYNFVDANPVLGMQYYRLQQNDINGDFTYSAIAPVNFTNAVTSQISIFPMPANNFINVELPGVSEMSVTIYNANGQKVFEATSGNLQTIDIQDFNAGLYIIEVKADNNVISSKFLKN